MLHGIMHSRNDQRLLGPRGTEFLTIGGQAILDTIRKGEKQEILVHMSYVDETLNKKSADAAGNANRPSASHIGIWETVGRGNRAILYSKDGYGDTSYLSPLSIVFAPQFYRLRPPNALNRSASL